MDNKWIYYGIFFNENIKKALLKLTKVWLNIHNDSLPEDWTIYCDHVTIVYNDKSIERQKVAEEIEKILNTDVTLSINSIGVSSSAIALGVDYKTQNKHSHITIATAPGVRPVESNNIIRWFPISGNFTVNGTIKKIVKK